MARTKCAVLGSPIAHSLSPVLHRAAYAALGLTDWTYDRFEAGEAELPGFVAERDQTWRGLSLTMPLKVVALSLGEIDPLAGLVGAGNTLIFDDDHRRVFNTDIGGQVAAVRGAGLDELGSALILGTGATARSALASVSQLGARHVVVVARTLNRAEEMVRIAAALGVELEILPWGAADLPSTDLLISTVTAGGADSLAQQAVSVASLVFDVVYEPWPTALASAAESAGVGVLNGLDLLVGQAVLQVELMTGEQVDPAILMSAGRTEISRRHSA